MLLKPTRCPARCWCIVMGRRDRQFNNIEREREVEKKTSHCVTRFQCVPRERLKGKRIVINAMHGIVLPQGKHNT